MLATFIFASIAAVFSYLVACGANQELPWIKLNKWVATAIGFVFGYVGLLGVCLYILYKIVKYHNYNE